MKKFMTLVALLFSTSAMAATGSAIVTADINVTSTFSCTALWTTNGSGVAGSTGTGLDVWTEPAIPSGQIITNNIDLECIASAPGYTATVVTRIAKSGAGWVNDVTVNDGTQSQIWTPANLSTLGTNKNFSTVFDDTAVPGTVTISHDVDIDIAPAQAAGQYVFTITETVTSI